MPKTADLLEVADEPPAPVARKEHSLALVIERIAINPNVDVVKLEKIIELQERVLRHKAEADFNAAFSKMQREVPTVKERASTDKGTYAPLEDIVDAVRPILAKHGFSLGFQTEWPDKNTVKVIGILTRGTHARRSEFQAGADQSGSKNAIQALASSVSYGKRYATKDLLCIVTRGEDDDANRSGAPDPPDGYENCWLDLMTVGAEQGLKALEEAWGKSSVAFKNYTVKHNKAKWNEAKKKAAKVQRT